MPTNSRQERAIARYEYRRQTYKHSKPASNPPPADDWTKTEMISTAAIFIICIVWMIATRLAH